MWQQGGGPQAQSPDDSSPGDHPGALDRLMNDALGEYEASPARGAYQPGSAEQA
eukprot:COSAG05_NODE_23660_length_256_cov_0.974522_1_plen_53_part_01